MTDAKRMKASSKQAGKRIGGTIGIFIFLLIDLPLSASTDSGRWENWQLIAHQAKLS